jgi:3-phosphoshikimate 1-carboxyvinyltransferase
MIEASMSPIPLIAGRSPWLRGPIRLPGDPAQSQLALILAAMARGESVVENVCKDISVNAVMQALGQLGVPISHTNERWHVQGIGVGGFLAPEARIDLGKTGSGALLLIALLAAHDFETEFAGVAPTPMNEALLDFLRRNGVRVERSGETVTVRAPRFGIPLDLALSAEAHALIAPLLLHCLVVTGRSTLHLPEGATDPAEGLLALFGAKLGVSTEATGVHLSLDGMAPLRAQALAVPGDPALAAYPAVAALLAPDSELTMESVALNTGGMALLDALALLGGDISLGQAKRGGHGVADITARHGALLGTTIPADLPIGPADYPILAVTAAFAEGETVFEGLGEGPHRLALTKALRANGVDCVEQRGGLLVRGQKRVPGGGNIGGRLDPKLAMSFLILGMAADKPVTIEDGAVMSQLFPGFVAAFEHVGASFSVGSAA